MIVRGPRPTDNFALIHNGALEDRRLHFKAKGILCYLLSRPPGWSTSAEKLADHFADGRDAIRSGLKELEDLGYLTRTRVNLPGTGKWEHHMMVTDQPNEPISGFSADGLSGDGLSAVGEPADINKTDLTKTDLKKTDLNKSVAGDTQVSPARKGWKPTPRAMKTARESTTHLELDLHVLRYETWCRRKGREPESGEWLEWVIRDEEKARDLERKEKAANSKPREWYETA